MNSNLWEPAVPCNGNLGFPRSDVPAMLLGRCYFILFIFDWHTWRKKH